MKSLSFETGVNEYDLGGKVTVKFNPTDVSFLEKLSESFATLDKIQEEVRLSKEEITEEKLRMIDQAEQFLIELGFIEERVRLHGNLARIEVAPENIPKLADDKMRSLIYDRFRQIGFTYVTLDMHGYSRGSMNATL